MRVDGQHVRQRRRLRGRFGLRCVVLIPKGKIAPSKLVQAQVYGARVVAVEGNFDDARWSACAS